MTTQNYVLFLDDERAPPLPKDVYGAEVVHAKNLKEFQKAIEERGEPFLLMFDWYLGVCEPNGFDAASWLIEYDKEHNILSEDLMYDSHSSDSKKARDIVVLISDYLKAKFRNVEG